MEFNINWTKDDNDKLRNFIKERKSVEVLQYQHLKIKLMILTNE